MVAKGPHMLLSSFYTLSCNFNATVKLYSGTFSPFIVSTAGLLAPQAQKVLNALAQRLSTKITGSYPEVSDVNVIR